MKKIHISIDLETMGTQPGCPILSIGAVAFGTAGATAIDEYYSECGSFYNVLSLHGQEAQGCKRNPETDRWWYNQGAAAFKVVTQSVMCDAATSVKLREFTDWVNGLRNHDMYGPLEIVGVWGYGSMFDIAILDWHFKNWAIEKPWSYRDEMCGRTLLKLADNMKIPRVEGTHHNAFDDARNQAKTFFEAMELLRNESIDGLL